MQQIQQKLTALQQRIADACAACGRDVGDITLIGVSKTKPAADVHAARNDWNALSMGMTGDLEHAIAAGATHIRIGTALFGARQTAL